MQSIKYSSANANSSKPNLLRTYFTYTIVLLEYALNRVVSETCYFFTSTLAGPRMTSTLSIKLEEYLNSGIFEIFSTHGDGVRFTFRAPFFLAYANKGTVDVNSDVPVRLFEHRSVSFFTKCQ